MHKEEKKEKKKVVEQEESNRAEVGRSRIVNSNNKRTARVLGDSLPDYCWKKDTSSKMKSQ